MQTGATQWYLRLSDGTTYGPVGLAVLWDWVTEGRVVPGNEVSNDGQNWVPAESVHVLNMYWTHGSATGEDFTKRVEELRRFFEKEKAVLLQQCSDHERRCLELQTSVEDYEKRLRELADENERVQRQRSSLQAGLTELQNAHDAKTHASNQLAAQLEEQRQRFEELERQTREHERQLVARVDELKGERIAQEARIRELVRVGEEQQNQARDERRKASELDLRQSERIRALEAEVETIQRDLASRREREVAQARELGDLRERYRAVDEERVLLRSTVDELRKRYAALEDERTRREADLTSRMTQYQVSSEVIKERAEALKTALNEEREKARSGRQKADEEKARQTERISELEGQVESLQAALAEARGTIDQSQDVARRQMSEQKLRIEDLESDNQRLRTKLEETRQELAREEALISELQSRAVQKEQKLVRQMAERETVAAGDRTRATEREAVAAVDQSRATEREAAAAVDQPRATERAQQDSVAAIRAEVETEKSIFGAVDLSAIYDAQISRIQESLLHGEPAPAVPAPGVETPDDIDIDKFFPAELTSDAFSLPRLDDQPMSVAGVPEAEPQVPPSAPKRVDLTSGLQSLGDFMARLAGGAAGDDAAPSASPSPESDSSVVSEPATVTPSQPDVEPVPVAQPEPAAEPAAVTPSQPDVEPAPEVKSEPATAPETLPEPESLATAVAAVETGPAQPAADDGPDLKAVAFFSGLEKLIQEREADQWFLRREDHSVYGPIAFRALCDWAAQCRIVTGDEVSQDRLNWKRADEVSALRLDWKAELRDGKSCGPFSLLAVRNLVLWGILDPDDTVKRVDGTQEMRVAGVLKARAQVGIQDAEATLPFGRT